MFRPPVVLIYFPTQSMEGIWQTPRIIGLLTSHVKVVSADTTLSLLEDVSCLLRFTKSITLECQEFPAFTWSLGTNLISWKEPGLLRVLAPGQQLWLNYFIEVTPNLDPPPTRCPRDHFPQKCLREGSKSHNSCPILQTRWPGRHSNVSSMNHHASYSSGAFAQHLSVTQGETKLVSPPESPAQARLSSWLVTKLPTGPLVSFSGNFLMSEPNCNILRINLGAPLEPHQNHHNRLPCQRIQSAQNLLTCLCELEFLQWLYVKEQARYLNSTSPSLFWSRFVKSIKKTSKLILKNENTEILLGQFVSHSISFPEKACPLLWHFWY